MSRVRTIADCLETPKFWEDETKMNAWFAPFRSRDLNPLNYDNKMAYWKNNVQFFCDQTSRISLSLAQVKSFFVRNGKTPNCLPLVFQNLLDEGSIQLMSDYEASLSNNTWSGWAVNKFINSPIKWSFQKLVGSVNSEPITIDENAEYIHLASLKKQSDRLFKCVSAECKDSILTYADIKAVSDRTLDIDLDLKTIELIVRFLETERKAYVTFDKHCNLFLIKFANSSSPVQPITDSEISVFALQTKEKVLIKDLEKLEKEKESLQKEVKELLGKNMRNMAKNTLRKQKELEKRIAKHVNVLENIQNLLYKVQDTEANSQILESYKIGADALKSGCAQKGLTLENVDNTMEEIEEALDTHNDIEETLGRTVGTPAEDAELENELADLLLQDAPSAPPDEPSSPPRKMITKSKDDDKLENLFPAMSSDLKSSLKLQKSMQL
ncbi:hypothetical protein V9T40_014517 [Parthenolecanium corni]|uniref:Charged multivesicular body protein 7 n=1 Tax=Parthenolecanium corni TaxID=536013 RepID=A0AAN9T4T2_9HEMI